jgi:hypothetical protein
MFELAFRKNLLLDPNSILPKFEKEIRIYFLEHTKILSNNEIEQPLRIIGLEISKTKYDFGDYLELIINFECTPDKQFNNRDFYLYYDAVTHQVANHFTIIKLNRDFDNGITPEDTLQFGVIELDRASNTIKPLHITLEKVANGKALKR